jgi:hypothetical protein
LRPSSHVANKDLSEEASAFAQYRVAFAFESIARDGCLTFHCSPQGHPKLRTSSIALCADDVGVEAHGEERFAGRLRHMHADRTLGCDDVMIRANARV